MALAKYNKGERENFEDIQESLIVVRNHLDLLAKVFHKFDSSKYFGGTALEQLNTLNMAAEYVPTFNIADILVVVGWISFALSMAIYTTKEFKNLKGHKGMKNR